MTFWWLVLAPLEWPRLGMVLEYFVRSLSSEDAYKATVMTGIRAILGMCIGFVFALILAILTGRTILGWVFLFIMLLALQKIPAVAMVHVMVQSKLGLGTVMTVCLASTVVMTFTWLILHHRARTLDPREAFALRVVGFKGLKLMAYGMIPHFGSSIGGAARLAMSISIVMVILGEWQGTWSDGTWWQWGLGVQISRCYTAIDGEAKVLAWCLWLGVLGVVLDGFIQGCLILLRNLSGVDLRR